MHPLAIYAVQVHLADLMAEAEANRMARQARSPRKPGLVASLVRVHPQPVRLGGRRTAPLPPPDRSRRPAGSLPAGSQPPGLAPPAREHSPAGRPPTLPGAGVLASPDGSRRSRSAGVSTSSSVRPAGSRARHDSAAHDRRGQRVQQREQGAAGRDRGARRPPAARARAGAPAAGRTAGRPRASRRRIAGSASSAAASSASTSGTRCGMSPPTTIAAASWPRSRSASASSPAREAGQRTPVRAGSRARLMRPARAAGIGGSGASGASTTTIGFAIAASARGRAGAAGGRRGRRASLSPPKRLRRAAGEHDRRRVTHGGRRSRRRARACGRCVVGPRTWPASVRRSSPRRSRSSRITST